MKEIITIIEKIKLLLGWLASVWEDKAEIYGGTREKLLYTPSTLVGKQFLQE